MTLLDQPFRVTAVLPQTGTIDDSRVSTCTACRTSPARARWSMPSRSWAAAEISNGLVAKINKLLPDAKVVTITQIADAQIKMNRMMSNCRSSFW